MRARAAPPDVHRALIEAGANQCPSLACADRRSVRRRSGSDARAESALLPRRRSTSLLLSRRESGNTVSRTVAADELVAKVNDALPNGTRALRACRARPGTGTATLLLRKKLIRIPRERLYRSSCRGALEATSTWRQGFTLTLYHNANPDLRTTKGTPVRRDTTDFNLPATLIGSTPYLLAARFLKQRS